MLVVRAETLFSILINILKSYRKRSSEVSKINISRLMWKNELSKA